MTQKLRDAAHWDRRYQTGDTPWDSQLVSKELIRYLRTDELAVGRAVELGCGTGTNAVFLAEHGFEVLAVDASAVAIGAAKMKAEAAKVSIRFVSADLCQLDDLKAALGIHAARFAGNCSFLFDRGCYHCARRADLSGFLETLEWLAAPSARLLLLCGNANDDTPAGPPRVTLYQIRDELSPLFVINQINEFRFEDRDGKSGSLGWSCWLSHRKPDNA